MDDPRWMRKMLGYAVGFFVFLGALIFFAAVHAWIWMLWPLLMLTISGLIFAGDMAEYEIDEEDRKRNGQLSRLAESILHKRGIL